MLWWRKSLAEERRLERTYPGYHAYRDGRRAASCRYRGRVSECPEPVERVARFLRETGTEARIEEFRRHADRRGRGPRGRLQLDQIVKSLVFVCDGRYVLAMVPGDQRGDAKRIAAAAGAKKARVAGAEQVVDATGFAPGAVAPFPLRKVQTVLIDRRLLMHEFVWVGAGSHRHIAQLTPADLVRLTKARTADLVEQRDSATLFAVRQRRKDACARPRRSG